MKEAILSMRQQYIDKIDKIFIYLDKTIAIVLFIISVVMLSAGFLQVLFRYVIRSSLSWSEELIRYLHVWVVMLGATFAIKGNQFTAIIAFYELINRKSPKIGRVLWFLIKILEMSFFGVLLYYGYIMASKSLRIQSPAIGLNMGIIYYAFPIGSFLALLYILFVIKNKISEKNRFLNEGLNKSDKLEEGEIYQ